MNALHNVPTFIHYVVCINEAYCPFVIQERSLRTGCSLALEQALAVVPMVRVVMYMQHITRTNIPFEMLRR
jgi:hypothetical protein